MVISTCNRTEIYLVVGEAGGTLVKAETDVLGLLARRASIRPTELAQEIYSPRNCEAARQLYRVTAGLESMILGEAEIQGQVKRAYEAAMAAGTTGPLSNRLFAAALTTGKRVRSETGIGSSRVSVPSVAVDLAQDVLGDLAERRVMLLGAGETSELTAQALAHQGVGTIFVANRHADRALSLAQRFGGSVVGLDKLPEQLLEADIVVSSTSSPHPIVGSEELALVMAQRRGRGGRVPLLLIDIAVPRDIDSRCGDLDGVTLYDIDDLQAVVQRNLGARRRDRPPSRADRRGGDPSLRALARPGRDVADRERSARARQPYRRADPLRERRPLGVGLRARPDARGGGCARGSRTPAARADDPPAQLLPGAWPRQAAARARAVRARRRAAARGTRGSARAGRGDSRRGALDPERPQERLLGGAVAPMRIGTRGSALALAQARLVAEWLGGAEIVVVRTRGDTMHEPLNGGRELPGHNGTSNGGRNRGASNGHGTSKDHGERARHEEKSRQEKEGRAPRARDHLATTSRAGWPSWSMHCWQREIDLAVHSAKDIPAELHDGLELLGSPRSGGRRGRVDRCSLARATARRSVRGYEQRARAAQLRAARGDLEVVSLRGNVDTRLRKLAGAVTASGDGSGGSDSSLHAIVLAKAGLQRLGRERDIGCTLDAAHFVPAPGQGALGLQARRGDSTVSEAVAPILDKDASACLLAERALAHALGASCNTPLGAHAAAAGCGCLHMHAWIGLPDGSEWIADELLGGFYDPAELGVRMAERLQAVGARELLARAEELAVERG